ncbi:hypothetical protein RHECNPAF_770023 [Rhizobium etli CNPAF512]|nr:hypothetical protein RHECNPAF_770023 [Rhizobium etli CNPAF512]
MPCSASTGAGEAAKADVRLSDNADTTAIVPICRRPMISPPMDNNGKTYGAAPARGNAAIGFMRGVRSSFLLLKDHARAERQAPATAASSDRLKPRRAALRPCGRLPAGRVACRRSFPWQRWRHRSRDNPACGRRRGR